MDPCVQCLGEMLPSDPHIDYRSTGDLSYVGSAYRYTGRPGQAVRVLKYARGTSLVTHMADAVSSKVEELGIEPDLVVPVPIHWTRLIRRGFNQAELIASGFTNVGVALRRSRATRSQAGLNSDERLRNLAGAFEAITDVRGKRILLIDDVVTSGQTFTECATVLRRAGAVEVGGFAYCGDV